MNKPEVRCSVKVRISRGMDSARERCLGNAVTVSVVQAIGEKMRKEMQYETTNGCGSC